MQKNSILVDELNYNSADSFSIQNSVQNSKLHTWKENSDTSKPKDILYIYIQITIELFQFIKNSVC